MRNLRGKIMEELANNPETLIFDTDKVFDEIGWDEEERDTYKNDTWFDSCDKDGYSIKLFPTLILRDRAECVNIDTGTEYVIEYRYMNLSGLGTVVEVIAELQSARENAGIITAND